MLIILEGVDLAGKTFLADRFAEKVTTLGGHVTRLKAGQPEPLVSALDEYELNLMQHHERIMSPNDLVICDRWHVGERIYGPLMRGASRLSNAQFEHVELFLDALGARRIIVAPPSTSVLSRRYFQRGEELLDLAELMYIDREYERFSVTHYRWHSTKSDITDEDIHRELNWAGVGAARARRLAEFPGYVGATHPNILFVGDRPGGWDGTTPPNPAFYPVRGNSGHYLMETILSQRPRVLYGLVNANDGLTDLAKLVTTLGGPSVVALGATADLALKEAGLTYRLSRHPQYMKRFNFHQQLEYGTELFGDININITGIG